MADLVQAHETIKYINTTHIILSLSLSLPPLFGELVRFLSIINTLAMGKTIDLLQPKKALNRLSCVSDFLSVSHDVCCGVSCTPPLRVHD
jgi:hypothetical protein